MAIVSLDQVEAEWDGLAAMPAEALRDRIAAFTSAQPTIAAFVTRVESRPYAERPMSLAMQMALTIDELYARRLPRRLLRVDYDSMLDAQGEVAKHILTIDFNRPPILPPLVRRCGLVDREATMSLMRLMHEAHDEQHVEDMMDDLMIGLTLLRAYQNSHHTNLGIALRGRLTNGLLPPVQRPAPKARHKLLAQYVEVIGLTLGYFAKLKHDPIGKAHWAEFDAFETAYCHDDLMEMFCSLQMGYFLFDCPLGNSDATVAEHLQADPDAGLNARQRARLQDWTNSHIGIYEVVGRSRPLTLELRDLVTQQAWTAHELEHPVEKTQKPGDTLIARLLGPPENAFMPSLPFVYPHEMRPPLVEFAYELIEDVDPTLELAERYHLGMRRSTPIFAESIKTLIDRCRADSQSKAKPTLTAYRGGKAR